MAGGTVMELEEKTLESIGLYVRKNLGAWLAEVGASPRAAAFEAGSGRSLPDSVLLERLIRLEEELKAQRQIMEARFNAVDKRFEAVDKRFESMDKRFEDIIRLMDSRFEAVDKRFEAVDKRFEAVDKRFDDLIHHMDKRFEAVDKRFSNIQWVMGLGFTLMAGLMAVLNFF